MLTRPNIPVLLACAGVLSFLGILLLQDSSAAVWCEYGDCGKQRISAGSIFEPDQVEVSPRWENEGLIHQAVGYPSAARQAGIEGKVHLRVLVDDEGNYLSHQVVESYHPLLEMAVVDAVPFTHFRPALHRGEPVPCWKDLHFEFALPWD